MNERNMRIVFASGIGELAARNASFDSGVLRVAYTGKNRNNSFISKETFERCISSIYNCPIVCRYDRATDTIGAHDMELVSDDNGNFRIVNVTQPVGVVPESARYWWEEIEDASGVHEYLCVDVLIWKRQEAYQKIKEDGITDESMEISVLDGSMVDGVYVINRFEFTAFCLLGSANPCFESASLEMFSCENDFKQQFAEMMKEMKECFSQISTPTGVKDTNQKLYTEGGDGKLQDKNELAAKYGIDVESLDFSLEDYTEEELIERFEAMKAASDPGEPSGTPAEGQFALTSNVIDELYRALESVTLEREWGECSRYWYTDCDLEAHEVYCWDTNDWLLYGFVFTVDGDNIIIDFDSKKRKKYVIADFDEGEQASPFATMFAQMEQKIRDGFQWESKYQAASQTIATMEEELGELRQYKAEAESAMAEEAREKVFAKFEDLSGIEGFEQLRENCSELSAEDLEEKCYAIRGKNAVIQKFSVDGQKTPKLKVEKTTIGVEPYGGVFAEYGFSRK